MAAFLNLTNETVPTGPNGNAIYMIIILIISSYSMIVRVRVVLKRTVVGV